MNVDEINELADLVSDRVILRLDERYAKKDTLEKHERILKGKNGNPGLSEQVRKNSSKIKMILSIVTFIASAIVLEFLAWVAPRIETFIMATP